MVNEQDELEVVQTDNEEEDDDFDALFSPEPEEYLNTTDSDLEYENAALKARVAELEDAIEAARNSTLLAQSESVALERASRNAMSSASFDEETAARYADALAHLGEFGRDYVVLADPILPAGQFFSTVHERMVRPYTEKGFRKVEG